MATNLQGAAQLRKRDMLALYETTKRPVYFLCRHLLGDGQDAGAAFLRVYAALWKELPDKPVPNEQQLEQRLAERALSECSRHTLPESVPPEEGAPELSALVDALPARQRSVLLPRMIFSLSASGTARALNLSEQAAETAWNQAEQSLKRQLAQRRQAGAANALAYVQMKNELHEAAQNAVVPAGLDAGAGEQIAASARPEKRGKRWAIVAACAALVVAAGLGAWALFGGSDAEEGLSMVTGEQELHHAEIEIEGYGTISVELNATAAPETVANFISLAGEGFYDGLTFHRIIEGFMMQGGDPNGNGTGGSGQTIKGEFTDNGVNNPLSHTRGAISMARSSNYDSASSQFFIVHQDAFSLDGKYAVFGYVTDGMDIVDQICTEAEPTDNNGTIPADEQPVITTIRILD